MSQRHMDDQLCATEFVCQCNDRGKDSLKFDRYSRFQTSIAFKPLEPQTPNKCHDVGNIGTTLRNSYFHDLDINFLSNANKHVEM